jgi:hypothetical protein
MNDDAKLLSRPWRRYLRFSVRGLIVLVLLIGGWLGWAVRSAQIQRDSVDAITKAGGEVLYDWQWRDGTRIPGGTPWAPRWLVDRIGVDFFRDVTSVEFKLSYSLTDRPIVEFANFTRLQRLVFTSMTMSDAGLSKLRRLTRLRELDLSRCDVTDAEAANLKGLTSVTSLNLASGFLTDAGPETFGGAEQPDFP